jgi:hypothetical protein
LNQNPPLIVFSCCGKKLASYNPPAGQQQPKLSKIMKLPIHKKLLIVGCALLVTTITPVARAGDDYSFKVKNTTKELITKILVSEDGEKFGYFDIGKGIKPGETMTLVWDKSTNGSSCHQWFKAVWESGEEGKPVKFDFCEKDLELEF